MTEGHGTWFFTPSNGDKIGQAKTLVVTKADEPEELTLSVSVVGSGRITSRPSGIDCGTNCSQQYAEGQEVSLFASAAVDWEFESWNGASQCGSSQTCTIAVNQNSAISARFVAANDNSTEPRVSNFYPKSLPKGEVNTLTLEGSNLQAAMVLNIQGTFGYCEQLSAAQTKAEFRCKPAERGEKKLYLKDEPGGQTIEGAEALFLNVTEPANMAPRVWVANDYVRQSIVGDQYFITAQSYDAEANLKSIQVDWQADGNWDSVKSVSVGQGQAKLFSYFPQTTGTLNIRFRAFDESGAVGESETYRVNIAPKPVQEPAPVNTGGTETAVANTLQTSPDQCEANPITPANGAKIETRSLLAVNGVRPITFDLHYNSLVRRTSSVGVGWDFANAQAAKVAEDAENDRVLVKWSQNKQHIYAANTDGSYTPESHACRLDTLTKLEDGKFKVERSNRDVHFFDEFNFLKRIENEKGQGLDFIYNDASLLEKVIEPVSGNYIQYTYDSEGLLTHAQTRAGLSVGLRYADGRLSEITHADNVVEAFEYTELDQLKTRSLNGVVLSRTSYDEFGRAVEQDDTKSSNQLFKFDYQEADDEITTKVVDRNGQEKTMLFDKDYKLQSEVDALGNIKTYEYNEDGRPTSIVDGNGNATAMTYNEYGDVTSVTTPDGSVTMRSFDSRRNLLRTVDPLGNEKRFEYDGNNLVRSIDELGNAMVYGYNSENQLISETTAEGRVTRFGYTNGLMTTVTNPSGDTRNINYDMDGRVIAESDFENNYTRFQLDGVGRKISETDPLGNRQTWTYDARGNNLSHTDARGNRTENEYNAQGDLIKRTKYDNTIPSVWQYRYDGESRLLETTDPNGNTSRIERDSLGRMIKTIDGLGNETAFDYDANGNLIKSVDPLGGATTSTFDEMDRVVQRDDPLGNSTKSIFDALGRITSTQDAIDRFWQNAYDTVSRLVSLTHPADLPATQQFDNDGNLTRVITPGNHGRWLRLDSNARVTTEETHDGIEITFDYNGNDLLTSMTNGRGQTSSYGFDAASRMTQMDDEIGAITYQYDEAGNRTKVTEGDVTIGRKFDAFDRVTEYKADENEEERTRYDFDLAGNLTQIVYPSRSGGSSGSPIGYEYDELNRVKTVSGFLAGLEWATYEYDSKSRITKVTRGNGSELELSYDAADRLIKSTDRSSNGSIIVEQSYSYDAIGRLTQEVITPQHNPPAGLIANSTRVHGASNRLLSVDGATVNYDGDGNVLNVKDMTLEFNARNQLIKAGDYTYEYNAEGYRIARIHTVDSEDEITRYEVSPDNMGLVQTLRETSDTGRTRDFVYGPQGLIAQFDWLANNQFYFHYDYRGSVIAVTDKTGAIIARYGYLPYGQQYVVEGEFETPFGYNGRDGVISDPNNLIYMRARYYSPSLQRFVSKDPLRGQLDDLASLNRYAYVGGDPVNGVDPSGNYVESGIDIASIGVGVYSFNDNLNQGNYWSAAFDGVGIALDSCALALPGVPGGVGLGIKATRGASNVADGAGDANSIYRGVTPGEPYFELRNSDFRLQDNGFVRPGYGPSVFIDPTKVPDRFSPYRVDISTIPENLQLLQRGKDPKHFEITPRPGANLTPRQFQNELDCIICLPTK